MKSKFKVKKWTENELEYLYFMRQEGVPYRLIASELRRTVNACEKKYRTTIWNEMPFFDNSVRKMKEDRKKAYLERISRINDRRLQNEHFKTDIIADKLVTAVEALPKVNKPVYKRNNRKKIKHKEEDVGLMLSDMHIGHHHSLEETGGISEYDINVFQKRVNILQKATEDIYELHSNLYPLRNLHIFCLGDIVAGMNNSGNWSPTYINMPIYDQMITGWDALSDMVYYWLGMFQYITFYGVMGNHGRAAKKGVEKEYVNWDFICYKFLEARFQNNDRVRFVIPKTWWILTEIKNYKFLIIHGEDVKSSSVALNGMQKYEEKMKGVVRDIPDYTLSAHFHTASELTTNNGRLLINGSFIGPDIYSLKDLQSCAKPEQKIFGIHGTRGITWVYNLDLSRDR